MGAYAAVGSITEATPYLDITPSPISGGWMRWGAGTTAVIPPLMTGWDVRPCIATPSAWFGAETGSDPAAYWSAPTAAELAGHVGNAVELSWMRANSDRAPAQICVAYAWNEFTEGGWPCPTWVSGQLAGNTDRLTVPAATLVASGAYTPVTVEAQAFAT